MKRLETPTRRGTVLWTLSLIAVILTTFVVGVGAVELQFFGESADSEDYAVSAGGYGAGALVLILTIPALMRRGKPVWLTSLTGAFTLLFLIFMGSAFSTMGKVEQETSPINTFWDGFGGVLLMPWSIALVLLAIYFSLKGKDPNA